MKNRFRHFSQYFLVAVIAIASFFLYSSRFYSALNSDNAVTVLMTHEFHLPADFYHWGQDRMGSIIPLLGQIPNKLGISAIVAESLIRYILLLLGFLAFSFFIKSRFYKIVFAVIWFLPPMRMIDVTQFAFGIHYSLLAMAIYLYARADDYYQNRQAKYHICLSLITILLISAIWVSDMALISVAVLLCVRLVYHIKRNRLSWSLFKIHELYYFLAGLALGYIFIHFAKSINPYRNEYASFADLSTIKQTSLIFLKSITDLMQFNADEPFTGVYTYMVIAGIILFIVFLRKMTFSYSLKKWGIFFLADALILFIIIMISQWTFDAHVPRRYFTCTYIALSFFLVMAFDMLVISKGFLIFIRAFVMLTVLAGGLGTIYNLKYIWPKTLKPMYETAAELDSLGNAGLIGNYWNSYVLMVANPDMIKATPHEGCEVRNRALVDSVFAQPAIYIVKDEWLDEFPESLTQFGKSLFKKGEPFSVANCTLCEYSLEGADNIYRYNRLGHKDQTIVQDEENGKTALLAQKDFNGKYLVSGPWQALEKGSYRVEYYLKTDTIIQDDTLAVLDVVSGKGTDVHAKMYLLSSMLKQEEYVPVSVDFTIPGNRKDMEYRVFYTGHHNLYFDHLRLVRLL